MDTKKIITQNGEECDATKGHGAMVIDLTPDTAAAVFWFYDDLPPVCLGVYGDHEIADEAYKRLLENEYKTFYMPAPDDAFCFESAFDKCRRACNSAPGWDGKESEQYGLNVHFYINFFNYGAFALYQCLLENGLLKQNARIESVLADGFNGYYFFPEWDGTFNEV